MFSPVVPLLLVLPAPTLSLLSRARRLVTPKVCESKHVGGKRLKIGLILVFVLVFVVDLVLVLVLIFGLVLGLGLGLGLGDSQHISEHLDRLCA